MNDPTIQQPLSDDELNRLGEFLDEIGAPAMNMESEHGIGTWNRLMAISQR